MPPRKRTAHVPSPWTTSSAGWTLRIVRTKASIGVAPPKVRNLTPERVRGIQWAPPADISRMTSEGRGHAARGDRSFDRRPAPSGSPVLHEMGGGHAAGRGPSGVRTAVLRLRVELPAVPFGVALAMRSGRRAGGPAREPVGRGARRGEPRGALA